MKSTCLLFLTMSWAAWTPGTGFAVPSSPASRPTSPASSANTASGHPGDAGQAASPRDARHLTGGKAPDNQRNHDRASYPNHPLIRANLTKANHPKPLPDRGRRFLPGNVVNFHQPGSGKSTGTATGGLMPNEMVNNALPVRTPSVVRPTMPVHDKLSHRRPYSAALGGTLCPHCGNTGVINGTRMKRKF